MAKTMQIYGCGGCGINLVSNFMKHAGKKDEGFAEIAPFFLDTSKSNLTASIKEDHVYIVEGLDGSGKKRDANYRIISERAKEMLHRFKPADINVVVHSASGGSGSVIGPVLVSELLSRGVPTIVVMVGSSDSRIEAHNTVNTLKSYEVISHKRELPVVSVYYENSKETPRGQVDQRIQTTIVLLAAIFSGDNRELDSADLNNFLNYTRVSSFQPQLAYLDFFSKEIEVGRDQSVASLVTLTDSQTDSSPNVHVEYQATGFINEKAKESVQIDLPIHAAVVVGYFHDKIEKLTTRLAAIDESVKAYVPKSIVGKDIDSTDEGVVL